MFRISCFVFRTSALSLYRKYRSQSLDEIIGQDHIVQTLKNALAHDKVAHAYLFAGPRGTGKTSIARILGQELKLDPLDIIEIDAASHRGIDEVRALREQVQFQPAAGDKKLYILDEVHMLTKEAFNALLKTLEEPPTFVYFVLCTTEPHKLPVTIISRTQRFDFLPGTAESIETLLRKVLKAEKRKLPDEVIQLIARRAHGGYRDALSLLEHVLEVPESDSFLQDVHHALGVVLGVEVEHFIDALLVKDKETALEMLNKFSARQIDFNAFIKELLVEFRVRLLVDSAIKDYSVGKNIILLLTETARMMKYAPVPSLPLELAVLEITSHNGEQATPAPPTSLPVEKAEIPKPPVNDPAPVKPARAAGEPATWWPDVLVAIKPYNHTLEALLKGCTPGTLQDGSLVLEFKYKFHMERIEEPANKAILVDVVQQVSGQTLKIECVLVERTNGPQDFHGNQPSETIVIENVDKPFKKASGTAKQGTDTIRGVADEMLEKAMQDLGGKMIE